MRQRSNKIWVKDLGLGAETFPSLKAALKAYPETKRGDWHCFDSSTEYERWCDLKLMERAGLVKDLTPHPKFQLAKHGKRAYTADSQYVDTETGLTIIEDVKGVTRTRKGKRKHLVQAGSAVRIEWFKDNLADGRYGDPAEIRFHFYPPLDG